MVGNVVIRMSQRKKEVSANWKGRQKEREANKVVPISTDVIEIERATCIHVHMRGSDIARADAITEPEAEFRDPAGIAASHLDG